MFARSVDEALDLAARGAGPETHVLFGALPRRGEDGTAQGVVRARWLWADIDARATGGMCMP